jgi:hypothetical protein
MLAGHASMLIALHLGAHKTATTYIQKALDQSREALRADGVGYPPLDRIRSTITRQLDFAAFGLAGSTTRLLNEYSDCERIIFSDENIIGGLRPARGTKIFYGRRRARIGSLVRRLKPNPVKIYFAVRSYEQFVSAIYCEYIRHNPFVDTDSYLSRLNLPDFSWTDVVATLVELVGAQSVTIWRYEDFPALEEDVFGALSGGRADLVDRPAVRLRESLSAEAVEALHKLERSHGRAKEIRSRVKRVEADFPKGPNCPAFSAFCRTDAKDLRARYDDEMSGIERLFPGISVLEPHAHDRTTSVQSQ